MKRFRVGHAAFSLVLPVFLAVTAPGQAPLPSNTGRTLPPPSQETFRQAQIQRANEARRHAELRRIEEAARASAQPRVQVMPGVSGEELKRIKRLLTPHPDDLQKYKAFLDLDRTGIFKLFPPSICDESRVVRVDEECANSVPSGSRFSFRAGANTPDIHYLNDRLYVKGFFAHHLIANIGSVPIEELVEGDKHVGPLGGFVPSANFDGARSQSADIQLGILLGGTKYTNQTEIVLDSTYLLRIITYKNGNNLQRRMAQATAAMDDPIRGFERLSTDNRLDMIVAFRIIRKEENGNLTLIWRELSRRKPPAITFPEDQRMADFN